LLLPQEIERDMAEHREVLSGKTGTNPTLILMEGDIEHSMHPVLDAPMTSCRVAEGSGGEGAREDVASILDRALSADAPLGLHPADGLESRPSMPLLQPVDDLSIIVT